MSETDNSRRFLKSNNPKTPLYNVVCSIMFWTLSKIFSSAYYVYKIHTVAPSTGRNMACEIEPGWLVIKVVLSKTLCHSHLHFAFVSMTIVFRKVLFPVFMSLTEFSDLK